MEIARVRTASEDDNDRKIRGLLAAWEEVHRATDPQALWLLSTIREAASELGWFEPRRMAEFTILSSRRPYWDFGVCLIYYVGDAGMNQTELLQATTALEWTEEARAFHGFSQDYVKYEEPVWRTTAIGIFHLTGGITLTREMMDCPAQCRGLTHPRWERCMRNCLG